MPADRKSFSLNFWLTLFVSIVLTVFMLILFSIFHITVPHILREAEGKYLAQQLKMVEGSLSSARQSLALLTGDTAIWEQTARFVEGSEPDFIARNWTGKSLLESFRFNFVIFKDGQGHDVYTDFRDFPLKGEHFPPAELFARLDGLAQKVFDSYAFGGHADHFGLEGILLVNGTGYNVAVMPIIPSLDAAKPSGTLIFGNVLTNEYFQRLIFDNHCSFSLQEDAGDGQASTIRFDEKSVSSRTPITGIDGQKLALVMTEPRDLYAEGMQLLDTADLLMLLTTLIFGLALYLSLNRLLISPLTRLDRDVREVVRAEDFADKELAAARHVYRSTEFAALYASINNMLRGLARSSVSLAMLHELLESIDANIYIVDPDNDSILFMNKAMQRHLGIMEDPEGKTCWTLLRSGRDAHCPFCPADRLREGGGVPVVQEETNPRTGRHYRNTYRLIQWQGRQNALLQYSVDITGLKRAEQNLRQRLAQQRVMSIMARNLVANNNNNNKTDMLVATLGMAGEFLQVNKVVLLRVDAEANTLRTECEWRDASPASFRGIDAIPFHEGTAVYRHFIAENRPHLALDDINDIDDCPHLRAAAIRSLALVPVTLFGAFHGILACITYEHTRHWTPSDLRFISFLSDLLTAALEQNNREIELLRMSSIVDSSPQFIAYSDEDGNIIFANDGSTNSLGYTPKEMIKGGWPLILGDIDFPALNRTVMDNIHSEGSFLFEAPVWKKNGEERIFSFSCFSTQRVPGIGVITRDMTDLRRLEWDLISAKERAEHANLAKSDFLSRMSHEMRTPLNAVIGMAAIGTATADIEKKQYCLDKINSASIHLLGVINDILDMAKIEADKFELSSAEFVFEKMLLRVLNVVNFRIEEKRLALTVNISPDIPYSLIGDEQRLAQVIANLLSNAVKFTPEEGMITLSARKTAEDAEGCTLLIEVTDTGIGISQENQAKLFTAFEQADGGITRKFGGTGLGLAISKRIVALMGGEIWVTSEEGQGAAFSFTIRARRGALIRETALHSEDIDWQHLRILAVDDMPDVREYFLDLANTMGFDCTVAKDGYDALRILEEKDVNSFDVIFVDWRMPGMDGLQLATEILKDGAVHPIIIMISSFEQESIEKEAAAAGIKKFLPKPLFASTIVDAVTDILRPAPKKPADTAPGEGDCFAGFAILLAEDVEINREIVLTMLEDTGITIDCAENGEEACALFQASPEKYAMIFMDIHMPEVDGYEATRRIRAMSLARAKTIPIIAMTANVFREDVERCLDAGMNGHIGKPVNFEEMFAKLREVCTH